MKRFMVMMTLGVATVGCATQRWVYEKPGVTEAQRKQDEGECLRLAVSGDGRPRSTFVRLDRDVYNGCMQGRGYTVSREAVTR